MIPNPIPRQEPTGTVVEREPVVAIVTAGMVLLNLILAAVFSFVTLEPGQVAALFAIPNGLGAFLVAVKARGKVAPWEPIDVPPHAHDDGWDDLTPEPRNGL